MNSKDTNLTSFWLLHQENLMWVSDEHWSKVSSIAEYYYLFNYIFNVALFIHHSTQRIQPDRTGR